MDIPHVTKAYVLRLWFKAMGFCEASLLAALFIGAILKVCSIIGYKKLVIIEQIVGILLLLKILFWAIMSSVLFIADISPHCNGGVYAYGIILIILDCLSLFLCCCLALFVFH